MPFGDIERLTEEQHLELIAHILLDEGLQVCRKCENINRGLFCTKCGEQFMEETIECDNCSLVYPKSDNISFCEQCGDVIDETETEKRMRSGEEQPEDIWEKIEPLPSDMVERLFAQMESNPDDDDEITF